MINPQWLELPLSRTNVHSPKGVRAIEVRLYQRKACLIAEVKLLNFAVVVEKLPFWGLYFRQAFEFISYLFLISMKYLSISPK